MLTLALLIAIAIPICYAYRRSVCPGGLRLNHVTTFSFGFLFYWIVPIAAGVFAKSALNKIYEGWWYLFPKEATTSLYLWSCVGIYLSFMAGDIAGRWLMHGKREVRKPLNDFVLSTVQWCGIVLVLATIAGNYRVLFSGYDSDFSNHLARGTVTAYIMLLVVVALLYISDRSDRSIKALLCDRRVFPALAGCALLLFWGGRLYVMSAVLALAIYWGLFVKPVSTQRWALITATCAALTVGIGIARIGLASNAGGTVLFAVFDETLLSSVSLLYFLRFGQIAWANTPTYLYYDLLNLVPSALLPHKEELIKKVPAFTPFGALHSFISFNTNFGLVGSAIFVFCLALFMQWLFTRRSRQGHRVAYCLLSAFLTFTFFRDHFHLSLVKNMFETALLIPAVIVGASRFVEGWARKVPAPDPGLDCHVASC